jgi:hypothetical protein
MMVLWQEFEVINEKVEVELVSLNGTEVGNFATSQNNCPLAICQLASNVHKCTLSNSHSGVLGNYSTPPTHYWETFFSENIDAKGVRCS